MSENSKIKSKHALKKDKKKKKQDKARSWQSMSKTNSQIFVLIHYFIVGIYLKLEIKKNFLINKTKKKRRRRKIK